jgi:hypothetical protein
MKRGSVLLDKQTSASIIHHRAAELGTPIEPEAYLVFLFGAVKGLWNHVVAIECLGLTFVPGEVSLLPPPSLLNS